MRARSRWLACGKKRSWIGLVRPGVLAREVLGLRADGVDQGGGQRVRGLDPRGEHVLGEDGGGGAVVRPHVVERSRLGVGPHRVMVDHDVRAPAAREAGCCRSGAGCRPGRSACSVFKLRWRMWLKRQAQALHHLAVLGPADDAAVGHGDLLLERLAEDPGQDVGRGEGVGVRVVVGEHEPAPALAGLADGRPVRAAKHVAGRVGDQGSGLREPRRRTSGRLVAGQRRSVSRAFRNTSVSCAGLPGAGDEAVEALEVLEHFIAARSAPPPRGTRAPRRRAAPARPRPASPSDASNLTRVSPSDMGLVYPNPGQVSAVLPFAPGHRPSS